MYLYLFIKRRKEEEEENNQQVTLFLFFLVEQHYLEENEDCALPTFSSFFPSLIRPIATRFHDNSIDWIVTMTIFSSPLFSPKKLREKRLCARRLGN